MNERWTGAVERLSRVAGVRGALLVEAEVGLPVLGELSEGVNGTAVAALASSLFRRTAHATEAGQLGELLSMQLDAEDGHVLALGAGSVVLVVITEQAAQLGLVRLEAQRAVEAVR